MRISCTTENLKKGLHIVSHIVGKNQNLPILNNVLLVAEDGILTLSTTNLELGIQAQVRGKIEEGGSVTVPARLLTDYINNVSAETVELTSQDFNLAIKAEKSHTKIKGVDTTEFPLLPEIETKFSFEVDVDVLKKALQQTVFASSNDSARPELCSVLAKITGNSLIFAATDSYRLAEKKISITGNDTMSILIPQNTLQEVNRVFDDSDEQQITIEVNENQIKFSNSSRFLISRISEGSFPDYEQIIPQSNAVAALVAVDELTRAVRAASIFCRQGINDVKLVFASESITVSALNDQVGESEVRVSAEIAGDTSDVVFNYHYLLDVLSVVGTAEIQFEVSGSALPGVVRPKGEDGYVYVIMPIKQ